MLRRRTMHTPSEMCPTEAERMSFFSVLSALSCSAICKVCSSADFKDKLKTKLIESHWGKLTLSGPAFSVDLQAWGGGGLRGPDAKNQGQHQPIGMKLVISHYGHKNIPDAKFESGSSSSFGDMKSQNFPWKKGTSHQIRLFTPGKRV